MTNAENGLMRCDDEAAAAASTGLTAAQATSRSTAGEITRAMIPGMLMGARFIACRRAPAIRLTVLLPQRTDGHV